MVKDIPIWEKYAMSIKEASQYFNIGENKLRKIIEENKNPPFILRNGSRALIKRKLFERYIDESDTI